MEEEGEEEDSVVGEQGQVEVMVQEVSIVFVCCLSILFCVPT